jgi:hypothetical protein
MPIIILAKSLFSTEQSLGTNGGVVDAQLSILKDAKLPIVHTR